MPFSSQKVKAMLKIEKNMKWDDVGDFELPAGHVIGKTEILFEKIEDEIIRRESDKLKEIESDSKNHETAGNKAVLLEEFQKIKLKTATVLEAEKVKGSDKLLKLQIDLGNEKRQIVAGIAQSYKPDTLIGKTIIVVANLKPARIRGIESKGMLLAVQTDNGHAVLTAEGDVNPGISVS